MTTALRKRIPWPVALAGLCIHVLQGTPARAADCSIPAEAFLFEPMLSTTVAALSAGKSVTVVAIGSASTEGRAAGGAEYAWPQQFGASLGKAFPKAKISVVNLGKARQSAADMAARFEKEVIPLRPMLVIWQTGTVDAVQGVDQAYFRDTLQSGFERLRAVAEVVVMDAQFSRRTNTMIDFEPYEATIREVADANDVPLFPRRDLMRHWIEAGEITFNDTEKAERNAIARRLYGCIGRALAVFVARRPHGTKGAGP
jgi:lysophospholipase L1-like esterase